MSTLILLDDDEQLRQYYAVYLRACGYNVIESGDSRDVMQLIEEHSADCLITDLMMPEHEGMEGIFLALRVEGLRIIAISSSATFLGIANGVVHACMHKPFSCEELRLQLVDLGIHGEPSEPSAG